MPLQQREGRTEQGRWSEEKWERDRWVKFQIRGCQQRLSPCPHPTCTCCSLHFIVLGVSWEIEALLRVVAWDLILGRTRYMCCSLFMEIYLEYILCIIIKDLLLGLFSLKAPKYNLYSILTVSHRNVASVSNLIAVVCFLWSHTCPGYIGSSPKIYTNHLPRKRVTFMVVSYRCYRDKEP